ncbi:NAD(P)-dependent oxidoreductase [Promicromonospora sp. NPDC060204]|uniref:NAD(P)-dependent oxidoreductase n=1 Tax=Promicromonospora sp. NPDC060204 TaxID=3347071 RepID=UPI0036623CC7
MQIAVVGASGRTGRELVRTLTAAGHDVVAVVRDPARLAGASGAPGEVRVAEATDVAALAAAFDGVDAVASCLGPVPGESPHVLRDGITAVIAAMDRAGVRRLVAISASGWLVDGDDPLSRYVAKPILRRALAVANADLEAMEQVIRASHVDWTIMRPPRLQDRRGTGRYKSRRDGNVRWAWTIARPDLALAMRDALTDRTAVGQAISVAA